METICVKREKLLDTLRENRELHREKFEETRRAWQKKATKALKKAAEKAQNDGEITEMPLVDLPKPVSYLKSYDDAIKRLEYAVRDEVQLDDREFSAWVQDDWNWRGQFLANSTRYGQ